MRAYVYFVLIALAVVMMAVAVVIMGMSRGGLLFYVTEILAVLILVLLVVAYGKVVRPMQVISSGMDLLAQQDFASRLVTVGQRDADRIVLMFNGMMDKLKTQRLLVRERNEFLDLLIEASPMGIVTFHTSGEITSANPAAVRFLGISKEAEIKGRRMQDVEHPLARRMAQMTKNTSCTVRLSDSGIYKCSCLSYMESGWAHPFYLIESLTDELMAAEQRAYGNVIRMISHEVNNTMGGVGSMLSTLSMAMTPESDEACALAACADSCHDLSVFISRFADVVRIPEAVLMPTDLNVVVEALYAFLQTLCTPTGTQLSVEYSTEPVMVPVDVMLFNQVLVNIVKNSAESIVSHGKIRIDITGMPHPSLTVTDNGAGISPEVSANLFVPFFSTKPDGSGIGLTLIADILKKHNCHFSLVTSKVDGLTRFTIHFPKSSDIISKSI